MEVASFDCGGGVKLFLWLGCGGWFDLWLWPGVSKTSPGPTQLTGADDAIPTLPSTE